MRRGQYTLITFIIATFILLSLTGIVSNLLTDKIEQIEKAKVLTDLEERITMMKTILSQERQVGIDFTSVHLGLLGGQPKGKTDCGTILAPSPSWLMKSTPYWYSDPDTAVFYDYEGSLYSSKEGVYKTYLLNNIRRGLYELPQQDPFILDGVLIEPEDSRVSNLDMVRVIEGVNYLFLESGSHYITLVEGGENLYDFTLAYGNYPMDNSYSIPSAPPVLRRFIPDTREVVTLAFSSKGADIEFPESGSTGSATITIDGTAPSGFSPTRGINIVRLDNDGNVLEIKGFDMYVWEDSSTTESEVAESCPELANNLVEYLLSVPPGDILIMAVKDSASVCLPYSSAVEVIESLGSEKIRDVDFRDSWGMITVVDDTLICEAEADAVSAGETGGVSSCSETFTFKPYREYELCVPEQNFLKNMYDLFLNKYFQTMTQLAFNQVMDVTSDTGFNLRNFILIDYEAEVEKVGTNSVFITFFPLNLPLFKLINEQEFETVIDPETSEQKTRTTEAVYQGSPIVFDAFQSDMASFQSIGYELIYEETINKLINEIISKHSYFPVFSTVKLRGSFFSEYESMMNNELPSTVEQWRVTGFQETNLDLTQALDVSEVKPYCLYFLREACQLLSDEVPAGMRSGEYEKGDYTLFDEFTEDYIQGQGLTNWVNAKEACQECHDVGEFFNPCMNMTEPSCRKCFNTLFGESGNSASFYNSISVNRNLGGSEDVNLNGDPDNDYSSSCFQAVRDVLRPVLREYLIYRFTDLEQRLNEEFTYGWVLDAQRLNITKISFEELTASNQYFNSSCFDCVSASDFADCEFLTSDLSLEEVIISADNDENTELRDEVSSDDNDRHFTLDNSENEVTIEVDVGNEGNTQEEFYITILIDAWNDLDSDSDVSKFDSEFDALPNELTISSDYKDVPSGDDADDHFDVRITEGPFSTEVREDMELFPLKSTFTPSDYELNTDAHLMRVCVHTEFNDEFNWVDNCVDFWVGPCGNDGDLSPSCCNNPSDYGATTWLDIPAISGTLGPGGACCGDDDDKNDRFLADDDTFCYDGVVYDCTSNDLVGGRIRPSSEARNVDLDDADYIDYFCINPDAPEAGTECVTGLGLTICFTTII